MSRLDGAGVGTALDQFSCGAFPGCRNHAAERVARWIARAADTDEDPRTLRLWGRVAGVSIRTLQYGCSAAAVSPMACRDLARLLRLVLRAVDGDWDPLGCLNADPRTIHKLASQSGLGMHSAPRDLQAFLSTQQLVTNPHVLSALGAEVSRWEDVRDSPASRGRD